MSSSQEDLLLFLYESTEKTHNPQRISDVPVNIARNDLKEFADDTGFVRINSEVPETIELTEKGLKTALILRNKNLRANIFKKMTSEDYLLAVYFLSLEHAPEIYPLISMSELAEGLGLTNSAISEYIRTMNSDGTLELIPRKGVRLTEKGLELAGRINKKRGVLQKFFHEVLGIDSNLAEIEAHVLEHNVSNVLADRLKLLTRRLIEENFILKTEDVHDNDSI